MDNAIGHLMAGLKERGELNTVLPEHPMMLAALHKIERMRAALQAIANDPGGHPPEAVVDDMREIACKALADMRQDDTVDECLRLRAESKRLTAYARELQERVSTLVNENERLKREAYQPRLG